MRWRPNVTVAAVIEQDGRFLLVEERVDGRRLLNQPAGHLEPGESLVEAVVRETLEETARAFEPLGLVGVYRWRPPGSELTFLRFAFYGRAGAREPGRTLDAPILDTHWLAPQALHARPEALRSPLVLRCIEDYLAGRRYPLELLAELEQEAPTPPDTAASRAPDH